MSASKIGWTEFGEWAPAGSYAVGLLERGHVYGSATREWPGGFRGREVLRRVGKKAAGRVLDGRTWDEFPHLGIIAGGSRDRSEGPEC